jgi:hypothetical protein
VYAALLTRTSTLPKAFPASEKTIDPGFIGHNGLQGNGLSAVASISVKRGWPRSRSAGWAEGQVLPYNNAITTPAVIGSQS